MRMRYKLPVLYAQLNLLDSHDVSRFYSLCEKDPARMQLAVLFPDDFYRDSVCLFMVTSAVFTACRKQSTAMK